MFLFLGGFPLTYDLILGGTNNILHLSVTKKFVDSVECSLLSTSFLEMPNISSNNHTSFSN